MSDLDERIFAAPVVYGRTYEVDFRYLALPERFEESSRRLMTPHVEAALVHPEKLRGSQRWVFIRDNEVQVAAVVCETKVLAGPDQMELNRDVELRDSYLFAGWMFPANKSCFVPMDAEVFKPLLKYVSKHWLEKRSRLSPVMEHFAPFETNRIPPSGGLVLRSPATSVRIHPREDDSRIWASAFETTDELAICLGLPDVRYAIEGTFSEASVEGCTQVETVTRRPAARHQSESRVGAPPQATKAAANQYAEDQEWHQSKVGPEIGQLTEPKRERKSEKPSFSDKAINFFFGPSDHDDRAESQAPASESKEPEQPPTPRRYTPLGIKYRDEEDSGSDNKK